MAAANPGRSAILVAGLAEAMAGCIAMGGGSYLASEAEEGLYAAEIADDGREIEDEPTREIAQLALVLEYEGLLREAAERVANALVVGRIARQAWPRAGLQVMLSGSVSAAVGFAIGHLVTTLTA